MSVSYGPGIGASDEVVGDFSTAPTSLGPAATVAVEGPPTYYAPPYPSGQTLAPCDSGAMTEFDWSGAPVTSLEFTYKSDAVNDDAGISGNTFYFSAPNQGITSFPMTVRGAGTWGVGEFVDSGQVNGVFMRVTLLSVGNPVHPTNRPFADVNACGGRFGTHFGPSPTLTDQPQRFRVEWFRVA